MQRYQNVFKEFKKSQAGSLLLFKAICITIFLINCINIIEGTVTVSLDRAVEVAIASFESGNVEESLNILHQVLNQDSQHLEGNFALATIYHKNAKYDKAKLHYDIVLSINSKIAAVYGNLGDLYYNIKDYKNAVYSLETAIDLNLTSGNIYHLLGLSYHYLSNYKNAVKNYYLALNTKKEDATFHFDFGVSLQHQGKILESADHYREAIKINPKLAQGWINIAALHQIHGDLNQAIKSYQKALDISEIDFDLKVMAMTNLAIAFELKGNVDIAIKMYDQLLEINTSKELYLSVSAHRLRACISVCEWKEYFNATKDLIFQSNIYQVQKESFSSLLPFDTLLLEVDPYWALKVSQIYAKHIKQSVTLNLFHQQVQVNPKEQLNIGYLSYDFNDHPTSHLLEGLFVHHNRSRFFSIAYSYGKDDQSLYRKRIISTSDKFVNLILYGHEEIAVKIKNDKVHILIDAQGYTLGARPEIMAQRPAPIAVSFLVFPGTMGAEFIDYFIADRVVLPIEHQGHFIEKILYMPHSYQVNYYSEENIKQLEVLTAKSFSRLNEKLPLDAIVYVNFNKNTKLEPQIFSVWMSILQQVEKSVLWLLKPSKETVFLHLKENLSLVAQQFGVNPKRIIFAKRNEILKYMYRCEKMKHLARHQYGDLFLDSFLYGAHSTATDALRGGLPVLTLPTGRFPSRVSSSLLRSLNISELITVSKKDYEMMAVYLGRNPKFLMTLKSQLKNNIKSLGLFQTKLYTYHLEEGYRLIWNLYMQLNSTKNIVLPESINPCIPVTNYPKNY